MASSQRTLSLPEQPAGRSVSRTDIPSLDGLRAISIGLVLLGHANGGPHSFGFHLFLLHADLGVRVFFTISGFLITGLLLKERSESGNVSLRLFYIRRGLRLLPAFLLYVACVAILQICQTVAVRPRFWLYVFTYTVNFAPSPPWALVHLWSLSVEEQFYMLWPVVVKNMTPRTMRFLAVCAILANPALHGLHRLSGIQTGAFTFPIVCGPIAIGCLLAMSAQQVRAGIVSSKLLSAEWFLILVAMLLMLLDTLPGDRGAPSVFLRESTNFMVTFCIARLVFIPTGVMGALLNSGPAILVGKLSYSLYLWQQLFFNPYSLAPISISFPLNLLAVFGIASLSYWGLEVRFLELRSRFRRPR